MIAFNPADHPAWMAGWQASAADMPREAVGWQTDRAKEIFYSGYDAERRNAARERHPIPSNADKT